MIHCELRSGFLATKALKTGKLDKGWSGLIGSSITPLSINAWSDAWRAYLPNVPVQALIKLSIKTGLLNLVSVPIILYKVEAIIFALSEV